MPRPNDRAAIQRHITGLRTLKRQFQRLPEVVQERMNTVTLGHVMTGARYAQEQIRRSPSIETRALHDHIGWAMNWKAGRGSFGVTRATTTLVVGGKKVRVKGLITPGRGGSARSSAGATKDNPARRAHFVEFGTVHMPAEPFMIPSAERIKGSYLRNLIGAGGKVESEMAITANMPGQD